MGSNNDVSDQSGLGIMVKIFILNNSVFRPNS